MQRASEGSSEASKISGVLAYQVVERYLPCEGSNVFLLRSLAEGIMNSSRNLLKWSCASKEAAYSLVKALLSSWYGRGGAFLICWACSREPILPIVDIFTMFLEKMGLAPLGGKYWELKKQVVTWNSPRYKSFNALRLDNHAGLYPRFTYKNSGFDRPEVSSHIDTSIWFFLAFD